MLGSSKTVFASEIVVFGGEPFGYEIPKSCYNNLQVGDRTTIYPQNFSYEIIKGNECVKMESLGGTIEFIKDGDVQIKVKQLNTEEEQIYDFQVYPAVEETITYLVPEALKIGDSIGFKNEKVYRLYEKNNVKFGRIEGMSSALTQESWRSHFLTIGGWGGPAEPDENRVTYGWLPGIVSSPGTFLVSEYGNEDSPISVTIEEPVIKSNLPAQATVGSTAEFNTMLENTSLTNISVEETKRILNAGTAGVLLQDNCPKFLGYQSTVEIINGADLVQRENQNYTNILNTSEKIHFVKEGEVTFKVTYSTISVEGGMGQFSLTPEATYNPEATFTVKVVPEEVSEDVILDYSGDSLPTTKELLNAIKNAPTGKKIIIYVDKPIILDIDVLKAVKDGQHELVINRVNDTKNLLYSWDTYLTKASDFLWNTDISFGAEVPKLSETLSKIKFSGALKVISYAHEGILPGKCAVKLFVGDEFKNGSTVYYYYFNNDTQMFEKTGDYQVDGAGYVTVEMEHCSDYVFTDKPISTGASVGDNKGSSQTIDKENARTGASPNTGDKGRILFFTIMSLMSLGIFVCLWKKRTA